MNEKAPGVPPEACPAPPASPPGPPPLPAANAHAVAPPESDKFADVDVALLIVAAEAAQKRQRLQRLAARLAFVAAFGASTVFSRRFGDELAVQEALEQHFTKPPASCLSLRTPHEVRPWLREVLLPEMLWQEAMPAQLFHSSSCRLTALGLADAPAQACAPAYVRGRHRLVSPVRLRQVVVEETRCGQNAVETCWPSFAAGKARTRGLCTSIAEHHCRYSEELPTLSGRTANYGRASFALELPTGVERAWRAAWEANFGNARERPGGEEPWLSPGTRAFSAELVLYTASLEMLTLVRILFEISAGGRVQPSLQTSSVQARPYDDFADAAAIMTDVLFALTLAIYSACVTRNLYRKRSSGLLLVRSIPEFANLVLHLASAMRWLLYIAEDRSSLLKDASKDADGFPDLERLIGLSDGAAQMAALNMAFAFFAILWDLQAFLRFEMLLAPLRLAATLLLSVALGLSLAAVGFAACGRWLLGAQAEGFDSFSAAMATLLSSFFLAIDYPRLTSGSPRAAPLFIGAWVLLVLMAAAALLISVFAAALEDARAQDARRRAAFSNASRSACCEELAAAVAGTLYGNRCAAVATSIGKSAVALLPGLAGWKKLSITPKDIPHMPDRSELFIIRRLGVRLAEDGAALASLRARLDADVDRVSTEALAGLLAGPGCRTMRRLDAAAAEVQRLASALHSVASQQKIRMTTPSCASSPCAAESGCGGVEPAATAATEGETRNKSGQPVEFSWSRNVDEEVQEALNMLRFELLSLSEVAASCEAPLGGIAEERGDNVQTHPGLQAGASPIMAPKPPPELLDALIPKESASSEEAALALEGAQHLDMVVPGRDIMVEPPPLSNGTLSMYSWSDSRDDPADVTPPPSSADHPPVISWTSMRNAAPEPVRSPRQRLESVDEQLPMPGNEQLASELPASDWQVSESEWQAPESPASERVANPVSPISLDVSSGISHGAVVPVSLTPISSGPPLVPVSTNPIESGPQDFATEAAATEYQVCLLPNGRLRI